MNISLDWFGFSARASESTIKSGNFKVEKLAKANCTQERRDRQFRERGVAGGVWDSFVCVGAGYGFLSKGMDQ
ncbi:MAG: hypothetical protein AB3N20_15120 [Rhizobiaceae bacterium]